jgi:hypothetical protein
MSNAAPLGSAHVPERPFTPLPAFLSYLVPGLGQISQGRVGKGLLFLVCIYTLFFYGQYIGAAEVRVGTTHYRVSGSVYLPDVEGSGGPPGPPGLRALPGGRLLSNVYSRLQFAGQFWAGVVVWPALYQYATFDEKATRNEIERLGHDETVAEDHGDAAAAARFKKEKAALERYLVEGGPLLGLYQRSPSEECLNAIHTSGDKLLELSWVYTLIAGVLNIMVIYDALAGPAFPLNPSAPTGKGGD